MNYDLSVYPEHLREEIDRSYEAYNLTLDLLKVMSIEGEGSFIEVNTPLKAYICKRKNFRFNLQAIISSMDNSITVEIARIESINPVRIFYTFTYYKDKDRLSMMKEIKEVFEILHTKFPEWFKEYNYRYIL